MKLVLVAVVAIVALATAAPQAQPKQVVEPVKIVKSEFDQKPEGAYEYSFQSEDGIERQEAGELKTVNDEENKPHEVVVVRGSYSYPDAEGKPIVVNYYADETGYHAEGDSIPKAAARR